MLSELRECYESADEILDSIDFELSCMLFENREWYENVSEISNMHLFFYEFNAFRASGMLLRYI